MKKTLIRTVAFAWTAFISIGISAGIVFAVVNAALAAGHGGRGGGSAPAAGSSSTTASAGRVFTPTAPRFPGVGAEHFVGRPHGVFPRAAITRYPSTGTSARPNLTGGKQPNQRLGGWSHNPQAGKSRLDPQTAAKLRNWGATVTTLPKLTGNIVNISFTIMIATGGDIIV
jgi:hypothetical protein